MKLAQVYGIVPAGIEDRGLRVHLYQYWEGYIEPQALGRWQPPSPVQPRAYSSLDAASGLWRVECVSVRESRGVLRLANENNRLLMPSEKQASLPNSRSLHPCHVSSTCTQRQ